MTTREKIFSEKPYFIADIGANHDGSIDRAFKLIELAKESGANAAKFQNFHAKTIVSDFGFKSLKNISHQSTWNDSVYNIYKKAELDLKWTEKLYNKCKEFEIDFFTSPYSFETIDYVDKYVEVFKIGSGDITWLEIQKHIAKKNKPILIATGASTIEDVKRSMSFLKNYTSEIVLMQCNTNYTTSADKYKYVNLNVIDTYKRLFPNIKLGLSDHTNGFVTVLGAIAKGATVIEKHFTDDNFRIGPDHSFAMNPNDWKDMVFNSNILYKSLGDGIKRIEENERESRIVQQRSLRFNKKLKKNQTITINDIEILRPCPDNAYKPYQLEEIIGKKLKNDVDQGQEVTEKSI